MENTHTQKKMFKTNSFESIIRTVLLTVYFNQLKVTYHMCQMYMLELMLIQTCVIKLQELNSFILSLLLLIQQFVIIIL